MRGPRGRVHAAGANFPWARGSQSTRLRGAAERKRYLVCTADCLGLPRREPRSSVYSEMKARTAARIIARKQRPESG